MFPLLSARTSLFEHFQLDLTSNSSFLFKNLTLISFFCDALVVKFDNDSNQTQ